MSDLAVQAVDLDGLEPDAGLSGADGAGDTWSNTGKEMVRVVNGSGSAVTVTIDSIQQCNQGFDHDGGGDVPAGEERWFGPFPIDRFGKSPDISYSAVTSVQVGVYNVAS